MLHTSEARRTLGVYLAPDSNNQLQASILLEKTKEWAQNTKAAHLDQMAAWLNITTTLIQQIYYALPATTLTQHQCEQIMRPCLMDGMAVAGYNWSFPQAIISAPSTYYGLNLTDMYTKQGIQHLLTILQYGHSLDDLTGWLLWGSLETMTLELGSLQNLFTQDYTELHQLVTNSWIKTVWQFQHHHNIQIKTDLPKLTIAR